MRTRTQSLLGIALAGLLVPHASAQVRVYRLGDGISAHGDDFGHAVAEAGDVDGDGIGDVVVGAPFDNDNGADAGSVFVYSGRTGDLIWWRTGEHAGDNFGWSVDGLGDIDGDGRSDIIAGARGWDDGGAHAPGSGTVYVLSGATSAPLEQFTLNTPYAHLGHAVAGLGDVDGDGFGDYAVSIPWFDTMSLTDNGTVSVFSGATTSLLFSRDGAYQGALAGYSLDSLRATGSRGTSRILIGAPGFDGVGVDRGLVTVRDAYGTAIHTLVGSTDGEWFGASVAGIGYVDGDASYDYAVGSPYADVLGVGVDAGVVRVFSGTTHGFLRSFTGSTAGALMGWSLDGPGDVDGDGKGEVLAGAPLDDSGAVDGGEVRLVSGANGLVIRSWTGGVGDEMGSAVSAAGDLNGDGRADFVIGARDAPFGAGEAYVHLGGVEPPTVYCTAKVNSEGCTPRIGSEGVPSLSIAEGFTVTAEDVLNHRFGILFWGRAPNAAPFMGGTLCVQAPTRRTPIQNSFGNLGPNDCTGTYAFTFSHAYMASAGILAGDPIHCQYWSRDPSAPFTVGLTDAVAFDVVP